MHIRIYFSGSCAVSGINELGSHKNPRDAMLAFCKAELIFINNFTGTDDFQKLAPFYVFVAGPEVPYNAPGGSHHSKPWVRYGTEFAQFLVENGLGEVVTLGPKFNAKHHPESTAQVWLWSPNQQAVEKWWSTKA